VELFRKSKVESRSRGNFDLTRAKVNGMIWPEAVAAPKARIKVILNRN
jgi:hypothetical protein